MTGAASCRDCGRPLSDPASQARGVGPVCWGTKHASRPRRRRAADQPIADFPDLPRAPRRWRHGDRPPPLAVRILRDRDGDRWHRVGRDGWIPDGGDPDFTSTWLEGLRFAPLLEDKRRHQEVTPVGETLSRGNEHSQRVADAANCPRLTGNAAQRASRADKDAADFAMMVREEPPDVVWGRVARWAERYPQRFQAAFVHLAALVDIDQRPAVWTREIGGTSALHPDYRGTETVDGTVRPADRTPELAAQIVELAATSKLSDVQIAIRFAVPVSYVVDVRRAARVLRASGKPGDAARDTRIAELRARGMEINVIADEVGVNRRTVLRSLARIQGRARNRRDAAAA